MRAGWKLVALQKCANPQGQTPGGGGGGEGSDSQTAKHHILLHSRGNCRKSIHGFEQMENKKEIVVYFGTMG